MNKFYNGGVFMPRYFIHFTFILFLLTALSGVWMRTIPFLSFSALPYDNILHAHSHIAILGWAFLGVFIILLSMLWSELKGKKHAIILTITIFIVSAIMFVAFLYEGYAKYSIIMSTIHIFVEYWAAIFIYKHLKRSKTIPMTAQLFMKGALIALVLSSIGPFALGYLGATGLRDSAFFDMSIYFFLHFQYNGWLTLGLIGLFIMILAKKGIHVNNRLSKISFWVYFIALFPWYLSAIVWANIGTLGETIATVGNIGQWIGTFLIIGVFLKSWSSIKKVYSQIVLLCLSLTFLLLGFKSIMELGLIYQPLSVLVFDTRPVIIGYLHLTLLGFVSIFIMTQLQMLQLIGTKKDTMFVGIILFLLGFLVNELLLFMSGLMTWVKQTYIPFANETLLVASFLLLLGVSFIWLSFRQEKHSHM